MATAILYFSTFLHFFKLNNTVFAPGIPETESNINFNEYDNKAI